MIEKRGRRRLYSSLFNYTCPIIIIIIINIQPTVNVSCPVGYLINQITSSRDDLGLQ